MNLFPKIFRLFVFFLLIFDHARFSAPMLRLIPASSLLRLICGLEMSAAAAATTTIASTGEIMKEVISTPNAPAAIGPYSQAIRAGPTLYVSGCIGLDAKTGVMVSAAKKAEGASIEQLVTVETVQVLENMKAVLEAGGSSLSHVVKCTVLLTSMDHFATVNAIYAKYFPTQPPARSTFGMRVFE